MCVFLSNANKTLHFCYGLGALLSPIIAGPFLRDRCQGGHFKKNIFGWTLENSTFLVNYLEHGLDDMPFNVSFRNVKPTTAHSYGKDKSYVQCVYWIVASLQVNS